MVGGSGWGLVCLGEFERCGGCGTLSEFGRLCICRKGERVWGGGGFIADCFEILEGGCRFFD